MHPNEHFPLHRLSSADQASVGRCLALLLSAILFAGLVFPLPAQELPLARPDLRSELTLMVDRLLSLEGTPHLDAAAVDTLEQIREELAYVSDQELFELEPMAPQVAEMGKAFEILNLVADRRVARAEAARSGASQAFDRSHGPMSVDLRSSEPPFPEAAYPSLAGDIERQFDVLAGSFSNPLDSCCRAVLLGNKLGDILGIDVIGILDAIPGVDFCDNSCSASKPGAGPVNGPRIIASCDAVDRSTTLDAYATRTAFIVAEAARDVANRICAQSIGLLVAGGNASILCIPMDLAFIVAKSVHDNLALCDSFIDGAEIEGGYERIGHLHGDLEAAQADLVVLDALLAGHAQGLANHDTAVKNKVAANLATINGAIGDAGTAVVQALAEHDLTVDERLAQSRAFFTRLEIEEALLGREREAIYYLPAAQGGHLELARTIVAETIAAVTASGESVWAAAERLDEADRRIAAGSYKRAFDALGDAYFQAIRRGNENQPSSDSLP